MTIKNIADKTVVTENGMKSNLMGAGKWAFTSPAF